MPPLTVEQIRKDVSSATLAYNASVPDNEQIESVSLFGSYADGRATHASDVDLLVRFTSAVVSLFTLARVLESMEEKLGVSVDVVQDPVPEGSLLLIHKVVPLYERA
ncbi:nucleotidyltransferase family protein [Adlercreutzia sp. ZJ141]|uniref:nucleotidyltransferase family protein n=1 Tax=Adlercreutzia sp. ZJ141 TaxID=2709406 RepID=UPI0013EBBAD4|nr:nucleotidyltransferase domain-containing protein [Adlercreutzia sp. ZJ141]